MIEVSIVERRPMGSRVAVCIRRAGSLTRLWTYEDEWLAAWTDRLREPGFSGSEVDYTHALLECTHIPERDLPR